MSLATEMLSLYLAAEQDILQYGQTSRLADGKTLSTAALPDIIQGRQAWEKRVQAEAAKAKGHSALYSLGRIR